MQTRRNFIKSSLLAGAAFGLASGASVMAGSRDGSASKEKPCKRKPNIVFIMADDLGYGELSATGQKYYKTPNIDSLAQNGIRYNQFYSGSTVCAPSRCSLMTGLTTGDRKSVV